MVPSQIHRHRVEQRGEVLLGVPYLQTGSRHHHRQLRKSFQNRLVNVLSVSCWCSVRLPERCSDGVVAQHVNGDSTADRFPNDGANDLPNMGTSTASAGVADPGNKQSMGRKLVKQFDHVRNRQGRDSDGRLLVPKIFDSAIAEQAVLEVCPSDSSAAGVNRQGSTQTLRGYLSVRQEYCSP